MWQKTSIVIVCTLVLAGVYPTLAQAQVHNLRQVEQGYWAGGEPASDDMADLSAEGIRLIISAVYLNERQREAATAAGIEPVYIRIGSTFPNATEVLEAVEGYAASEILVSCSHGGDRAGALLAFLLVIREGWRPDHAILAVASPGRYNINQVIAVLEEYALSVTEEERQTFGGIYSGASNGGTGGLKAHDEPYRNLIRTTLDAFEDMGIELDDGVLEAGEVLEPSDE